MPDYEPKVYSMRARIPAGRGADGKDHSAWSG